MRNVDGTRLAYRDATASRSMLLKMQVIMKHPIRGKGTVQNNRHATAPWREREREGEGKKHWCFTFRTEPNTPDLRVNPYFLFFPDHDLVFPLLSLVNSVLIVYRGVCLTCALVVDIMNKVRVW